MKHRKGCICTINDHESKWFTRIDNLFFHIHTGNPILKNQYCYIIKLLYEK